MSRGGGDDAASTAGRETLNQQRIRPRTTHGLNYTSHINFHSHVASQDLTHQTHKKIFKTCLFAWNNCSNNLKKKKKKSTTQKICHKVGSVTCDVIY